VGRPFNSEIVTQAPPALLAHAYAHEEDDAFFGPVAASLLGLALFTRFPAIIAIGAAAAASMPRACERASSSSRISHHHDRVARRGKRYDQLRPYRRLITYLQSLELIHTPPPRSSGRSCCCGDCKP
jgi:hypothetical protein